MMRKTQYEIKEVDGWEDKRVVISTDIAFPLYHEFTRLEKGIAERRPVVFVFGIVSAPWGAGMFLEK